MDGIIKSSVNIRIAHGILPLLFRISFIFALRFKVIFFNKVRVLMFYDFYRCNRHKQIQNSSVISVAPRRIVRTLALSDGLKNKNGCNNCTHDCQGENSPPFFNAELSGIKCNLNFEKTVGQQSYAIAANSRLIASDA